MQTKLHTTMTVILGLWLAMLPYAGFAVSFALPNDSTETPDTSIAKRYPYLHFVEKDYGASKDSSNLSDEEFYNRAGRMVFPVNKFNLPKKSPLLKELANDVIPMLNRDSIQLLRVELRGAASPEGPFWNNKRLSQQRSLTLYNFLNSHLSQPLTPSMLSKHIDIEDYQTLLQMMRNANDPDQELVERLVKRHIPRYEYTLLKKKLQRIQGGRLWKRLLKEYFPQLRTARLILHLKAPQVKKQPLPQVEWPKLTPPDKPLPDLRQPVELELPRRELLSIKTNLLFYGVYMGGGYNRWCPIPNIAAEYYPLHGHFTFGASIDFPWWIDYGSHKFFEIRNYQLETRYYLRSGDISTNTPGRGPAFRGFYLQAYLHGGIYEIGFTANKGWKGEAFGGGVGAGYVMPITRSGHWRLEFGLQVGYLYSRYDPFQYENLINRNYHDDRYYYRWTGKASDFKRRQYRYNWLGPTRVGVTLTYDLLYRRQYKKGVSFKAHEPIKAYEAYRANEAYRAYKSHEAYESHEAHEAQNQERRVKP